MVFFSGWINYAFYLKVKHGKKLRAGVWKPSRILTSMKCTVNRLNTVYQYCLHANIH